MGGEQGVFGRSEASDVGLQPLIGEACGRRFRGRVFRASGTSARRRGGFLWSPSNAAAPVFLSLCSGCPGAAGGRGLGPDPAIRPGHPPPGLPSVLSTLGEPQDVGPLSRAGELRAHPLPRLGWEVAGGETWDVQSDGQLLQLVQAVAGACQVG